MLTQTLACCNCRGFAGCGRAGADLRLGLGRLASWWLAPWLGLGGPRIIVGGPAYYAGGYGGCYVRRLVGTLWARAGGW